MVYGIAIATLYDEKIPFSSFFIPFWILKPAFRRSCFFSETLFLPAWKNQGNQACVDQQVFALAVVLQRFHGRRAVEEVNEAPPQSWEPSMEQRCLFWCEKLEEWTLYKSYIQALFLFSMILNDWYFWRVLKYHMLLRRLYYINCSYLDINCSYIYI